MLTILGLLATGAANAGSQQHLGVSQQGPAPNSVQPTTERIPAFATRFSNGLEKTTQEQKERKSRSTYIWGGAILGGLITAVAIAVYVGTSGPDIVMHPVALLPAIIGGAIIGGIVGAVISR